MPDALASFHPLIRRWFGERFGRPTDAQARAWPLIAAGQHVLVSAPTGSGKTLTAFLAAVDRLLSAHWASGAVRVLYLSPLKALNSDVRLNLLGPLAELRALAEQQGVTLPPLRVMTRSGDTPDSERRAMLRHPPEILITTPESLNLLLTSGQGRQLFGGLKTVILDEIHALAASKRGTYMMTAVERLTLLAGEFQRIALSATVRPARLVADWMGGFVVDRLATDPSYRARPVTVVESDDRRALALTVRTPAVEPAQGPEAIEQWWTALAEDLRAIIRRNRSTLVFANSRRTVEKITRLLNRDQGEPVAYAHHGSLSREIRLDVEERMKQGRLKAVVATGSLELGIDIGSVDEVILVGTPPSVAQCLQRIGRADHRVGGTSRAALFPLHGLDSAEAASMATLLAAGAIEELRPIAHPLDVLGQVLLSMGCGASWNLDQLFAFVRAIAAYHELPRRHFDLVIAMLAGRYADAPVRELRPRALVDPVKNTFTARAGTELVLYQSGGTIPDRGYYHLRLADSKAVIGELDEEFVWERRLGDQFILGTQAWRILAVTANDVEVGPADGPGPMIPFWKAEQQSRSTQASLALLDFFDHCEANRGREGFAAELGARHGLDPECARRLEEFLERQYAVSRAPLPGRQRVLVECRQDPSAPSELQQVVVHTFWGGRANRPLAIALAEAWEAKHGSRLETFANNDQIMCLLPEAFDPVGLFDLVGAEALPRLLRAGLEKTSLFGARFRENAGRALLLPRGDARKRYPLWLNRLRSKKLLASVSRFADFPVVLETWRDLLEDEFDLPTLTGLLDDVASKRIALHVCRPPYPTPFSEGVVFSQTNYHMYLDDAAGPAARSGLADELVRDLFHGASAPPPLPQALVARFASKLLRTDPDYRPGSREEVWLAVREIVLPTRALVDDWLAQLPVQERTTLGEDPLVRLVRYQLPGGSQELVSDLGDVPRVLALRGAGPVTVRPLFGEASAAIEGYLRDNPFVSDTESAASLLGDFLRSRAVVFPDEIAAALGFGGAELAALLGELLETESIVAGRLVEGRDERGFCDAENAERLLRLERAARREHAERQLAARPLADLPAFLADWQGLGPAPGGLESLQAALDRLFGFPLPAELWETAVLPARLEPYYPSWLDTLFSSYGLGWFGCGSGKVSLAFPGDLELFVEPAQEGEAEPDTRPAIAAALQAAGERGQGFFDLAESTRQPTVDLAAELWRLAWEGRAATDSFETVRRGVQSDFAAEKVTEGSGRAGFRRWERSRPSAGFWRRLEVGSPAGPLEAGELDKERARIVLDRYGVVFRELLEHELPPLRWPRLFRALRLLELSGEIVAGHFFSGVPGLQFATRAAIERLAQPLDERIYFVNACDPASLCGVGLSGLGPDLPRRLPGNWLVMRRQDVLLVLQKGGRELTVRSAPSDPALVPALAVYSLLLGRQFAPEHSATVETVNGAAASASPYTEVLRQAGFAKDYRGMSLWKR